MMKKTGRRVLVIEDDAEGLEALRELLDLWGYEVDVGADGKRALALARSRRPEAVVRDLSLHDSDALEVIQRIKANDERVIVVAVSGWDQLEAPARAAGADWFVLKPDLEALERLLACLKVQPSGRVAATNANGHGH